MHEISNKVDFYITNICNLTCQNCNRFNSFNFKGWQAWKDYEAIYEQWGKLVKLNAITIMGGEPFLNPTLKDWISGLNRIFSIEVQVLTNGTRFLQTPGVYESMLWRHPAKQLQNHIGVSLHTPDDFEQIRDDIHVFLQGQVTEYSKDENRWGADWQFRDSNKVIINVYKVDDFFDSAIISTSTGYTLNNNTPISAHDNCAFARWKSYHFIRGKFYKCGPSALLPEFDAQHHFEISDKDRSILNSYQSLTVDNFNDFHEEFFAKLDDPIAQCKFCSINGTPKKIYPLRKGLVSN